MYKCLIALTLFSGSAFAAPCTKQETAKMKKEVYAVFSDLTNISNTEEEIEAIDNFREDYEMSTQDIHALVEKSAARLKKPPVNRPATEIKTFGDVWALFCSKS